MFFEKIRRLRRWLQVMRDVKSTLTLEDAETFTRDALPVIVAKVPLEILTQIFARIRHEDDISLIRTSLGSVSEGWSSKQLEEALRIITSIPMDLSSESALASLNYVVQSGLLSQPKIEIMNRNWKSFSQEGEDLILERLITDKTGFFVDVGAHHPFRFSNTNFLYQRGWTGINIEPDFDGYELLKQYRPNDLNLNFAILKDLGGPKSTTAEFYRFYEGALNTFDEAYSKAMVEKGYPIRDVLQIEFRSLKSVLEEFAPGRVIDFMSVDCEGVDLDVLESNDWNQFRPKVIIAEVLRSETEVFADDLIVKFLIQNGYEIYSILLNSCIFVDKRSNL